MEHRDEGSVSPHGTNLKTRRTRFVCISDTHNCTVKLPKGDVLIHAGDLTNQGSYPELCRSIQWLERADFEAKIVIAGNHDITLDKDFYSGYGGYFHNQNPQDPDICLSLLTASPSITYLCHSSATIQLKSEDGPRTTFTVFGSPYSPRDGMWAFGYNRTTETTPRSLISQSLTPTEENETRNPAREPTASELWSAIPLDTDILVTHTPAYTHCDESTTRRRALGCEDLRRALWRVRPRLHVCGHVHEGRNAERVRWAIDGVSGAAYAEAAVKHWIDPSPDPRSARMSLVDLTARGGRVPLDNDGGRRSQAGGHPSGQVSSRDTDDTDDTDFELGYEQAGVTELAYEVACQRCLRKNEEASEHRSGRKNDYADDKDDGSGDMIGNGSQSETTGFDRADQDDDAIEWGGTAIPGIGVRGLGGDAATSWRCDREALLGRMGRRETCVINCAVTATNWPHLGGRRLNKPIVVDLDLPVLGEDQPCPHCCRT